MASTDPTQLYTTASAAPTVDNDIGEGYIVGSRWIDTTNDKEYVCMDVTEGAAVWTETTQSGAAEVNDLSAAVTWANIPDANVPASAVTQHAVAKTGDETIAGNKTFSGDVSGESFRSRDDPDMRYYVNAYHHNFTDSSGNVCARIYSANGLGMASGKSIGWYSGAPGTTFDTAMDRGAAGEVIPLDATHKLGNTSNPWQEVHADKLFAHDLPTSDPAVVGQIWNDSGTLKISAG